MRPSLSLEETGMPGAGNVFYNLQEAALVQEAIERGEGDLGKGGALLASSGTHTGRSPQDKFIVNDPSVAPHIWWENNKPLTQDAFDALHRDMLAYIEGRELFVQDLYAGADPTYRVPIRIVTELAWHSLFMRHLLHRPKAQELETFAPDFTILNCPGFLASPERHGCRSQAVIAIGFARKLVLIAGTAYAGENKKSVFSILNYLLPEQQVLPMHCSANHAPDRPDDVAIFFGLSGTGKTTLSADASRVLIGDDEHGWSSNGIFNFEGGCYAKTIKLSPEAEPQIYATTSRFASVIENMVYDQRTRAIDFRDASLTENTRCAYPLHYIDNASQTAQGGHPKAIFMLTCDAFGVLPPIAKLTPAQAMFHFLSGFTSKVSGTEKGVTEPEPTFSTCFGAPFMPRRPEVYGAMLRERIETHDVTCWLVNTGWTGGGYGAGSRMPIRATRALLTSALNGALEAGDFTHDEAFGFLVPTSCHGVPDLLLTPRRTWESGEDYDAQASRLVALFVENFRKYEAFVGDDVKNALQPPV